MVDLSTFDARLNYALETHGLDNAEFARRVDPEQGQQKVRNWRMRGRIGIPSHGLVRTILPGVSIEWLNDGAGPSPTESLGEYLADVHRQDVDWTDVRGFAQAMGLGAGPLAMEYAETHKLKFRRDSLARKRLAAEHLAVMYGAGDSMEPRVREGDAILFDTSDTSPRDGAMFVVMLSGRAGNEYQVKRCEIIGDLVLFKADNPKGDHNWVKPRLKDDKKHPIQIVGRVRWIGSWEG